MAGDAIGCSHGIGSKRNGLKGDFGNAAGIARSENLDLTKIGLAAAAFLQEQMAVSGAVVRDLTAGGLAKPFFGGAARFLLACLAGLYWHKK